MRKRKRVEGEGRREGVGERRGGLGQRARHDTGTAVTRCLGRRRRRRRLHEESKAGGDAWRAGWRAASVICVCVCVFWGSRDTIRYGSLLDRGLPERGERVLTMPFGPSVDLTRSAIATAPTNEACEVGASTGGGHCERGLDGQRRGGASAARRAAGSRRGLHCPTLHLPCGRFHPSPPWLPRPGSRSAVATSAVLCSGAGHQQGQPGGKRSGDTTVGGRRAAQCANGLYNAATRRARVAQLQARRCRPPPRGPMMATQAATPARRQACARPYAPRP